jgi:hypothetical protein
MNGTAMPAASQHYDQSGAYSQTDGQPWTSAVGGRAPAPGPVKKVRRWPWALGGLVLGLALGASIAGGTSTRATTATAAVAAPVPAVTWSAPVTVAAPVVTPAPQAAPVAPAAPAAPVATTSQSNAVRKAESYLAYTGFSKTGLVKQLKFEKFSAADAQYAVDHITVDWNEQAARKAEAYMGYTAFSKDGLIKQLKFDGFTSAEAAHGAASVGL